MTVGELVEEEPAVGRLLSVWSTSLTVEVEPELLAANESVVVVCDGRPEESPEVGKLVESDVVPAESLGDGPERVLVAVEVSVTPLASPLAIGFDFPTDRKHRRWSEMWTIRRWTVC